MAPPGSAGPPGAATAAQQKPPGPRAGGERCPSLASPPIPGSGIGKKKALLNSFKEARFRKLQGYPGTAGSAPRGSLPSDTWAHIQIKP